MYIHPQETAFNNHSAGAKINSKLNITSGVGCIDKCYVLSIQYMAAIHNIQGKRGLLFVKGQLHKLPKTIDRNSAAAAGAL